jgi:hypothetical protein
MTLEEPAVISLAYTQAQMARHRLEHRVLRARVVASRLLFHLKGLDRPHQVRALEQLLLLGHLQALLQLLQLRKPLVMSFAWVQMLEY